MANLTKRYATLMIIWDRDNLSDLTYHVTCLADVADDSEESGFKTVGGELRDQVLPRALAQTKDFPWLEAQMKAKTTEALQLIGTGAGGHDVSEDLGG
jgi:hypothetical protein